MFIERFAEHIGRPLPAARRRLFYACIPWWRRPFVVLLEWVVQDTFRLDWAVIDDVAQRRSFEEVAHAVDVYRYRTSGDRSFVRRRLGFRISGRRLLDLAVALFGEPEVLR